MKNKLKEIIKGLPFSVETFFGILFVVIAVAQAIAGNELAMWFNMVFAYFIFIAEKIRKVQDKIDALTKDKE